MPFDFSIEQIDHYRLEREIGRGGMGVVYRAFDQKLDRAVALKILLDVEEQENVERFIREAKALARLTHANVVAVYELGQIEDYPYFTMEFVEGISLMDILAQRGALVVEEALGYVVQACHGLEAAAEAGVVHRDIKPQNLLVQNDGILKIVDFGLARIGTEPSCYTSEGVAMGTPYYMAPEQARADAIDQRSDQYALGATLYHLLCGRPPFEAQTDVALLLKHQQEEPPPLPTLAPQVSPELWQVVAKTLAKDPELRFASYAELVDALLDSLDVQPERRKGMLLGLGMGLAGLLAAGLFAGLAYHKLSREQPLQIPVLDAGRLSVASSAPAPIADAATSREDAPRPLGSLARARGDLNHPGEQTRLRAIAAVGRLQQPGAEEVLLGVVKSADQAEQIEAIQWLARRGKQSATPGLIQALDDKKADTVLAAVAALSRLHDVRAVQPLLKLASEHTDPRVRKAASAARSKLFAVEVADASQ